MCEKGTGGKLAVKEIHSLRKCNITLFLCCFTDYTDGMRFYLIHMTEVREGLHVFSETKEEEKNVGFNVNSLFCL